MIIEVHLNINDTLARWSGLIGCRAPSVDRTCGTGLCFQFHSHFYVSIGDEEHLGLVLCFSTDSNEPITNKRSGSSFYCEAEAFFNYGAGATDAS